MGSGAFSKKRGHFLSNVRIDEEQVQKLRWQVLRKGSLITVLVVIVLVGSNLLNSAAAVASSQVPVDRAYLESLESMVGGQESAVVTKLVESRVISSVFTREVQYWSDSIVRWAESFNLDPDLVATVMQIESCGHPDVQSPAGATGLFQVMPIHFGAREDASDPETNARRGLSYLSRGLELANRNVELAFAGYNGGHSVIGADPITWSDETSRYVYWGLGIVEDILMGFGTSDRLEEWLSAGGASLCQRAAERLGLP